MNSDFFKKVSETFFARISVIAIGLVSSVFIARILGPEGRGLYAAAITTVAIGVQFANLGLHSSNTYFTAKDASIIPHLISNSLYVCFVFGSAITLIFFIIFYFFPNLAPVHDSLLGLALVSIPFGLAYLFFQNLLLGLQEIRAINKIEVVGKVLNVALLLALVALHWVTVENVFATSLLVTVFSFVWAVKRLKLNLRKLPRFSAGIFKATFSYGSKAYLAALFAFLVIKVDILLIQHFLGETETGYYSVASNLTDMVYILPVVIGSILFPKLSGMESLQEKWNFTKKVTRLTFLGFSIIVIASGLMGKPLIVLLYGKDFEPTFMPFLYLLPGIFFLGLQTIMVQFLNSLGFPRIIVWFWLVGLILNIVLNIYTLPRFGILGASLSSSISYFLIFILVGLLIYRTVRQIE